MINIDSIYKAAQALSKKDQGGYLSNDLFNVYLHNAQHWLMDYYWDMFEMNQYSLDSLTPFICPATLAIEKVKADKPSDYRHKLDMIYFYVTNTDCTEGQPEVKDISCNYLHQAEVGRTSSSYTRKPSFNNISYYFSKDNICFLPRNLNGTAEFRYITQPAEAIRAVTINPDTTIEEYDEDQSTNPAWNSQDQNNLVDLVLFQLGVSTRDSMLIQWLTAKSSPNKVVQ